MTAFEADLERGAIRRALRLARDFERAAHDVPGDITRTRHLERVAAQFYQLAAGLLPDAKSKRRAGLELKSMNLESAARSRQTEAERAAGIRSRAAGDAAVEAMHRRRERQVRAELSDIGLSETQIETALARLIATPRFLRVQVQDAAGGSFFGLPTANPEEAVPNLGKTGWCEPKAFCPELGCTNPRIVLDDGTVIWGYQCWWAEIEEPAAKP
jgi:hypothetical protein